VPLNPLQHISLLCRTNGGALTHSQLASSFGKLLEGRGVVSRFMVRDDNLLLDRLRESFLPDSPKVLGNRVWMTLHSRQLDVPKARDFFDKAGLTNPLLQVEDWQAEPHPSFQLSTEPEKFRTVDNRPLVSLRILCKPDGSFHAAVAIATDGSSPGEARIRRSNHPVERDTAWDVLSMLVRGIDPELGARKQGGRGMGGW
jgi:hypothetical protein